MKYAIVDKIRIKETEVLAPLKKAKIPCVQTTFLYDYLLVFRGKFKKSDLEKYLCS